MKINLGPPVLDNYEACQLANRLHTSGVNWDMRKLPRIQIVTDLYMLLDGALVDHGKVWNLGRPIDLWYNKAFVEVKVQIAANTNGESWKTVNRMIASLYPASMVVALTRQLYEEAHEPS